MNATEMATTFRQAAKVIRTGGLAQGEFEVDGAHCTIGALMAVRGLEFNGEWGAEAVESEVGCLVNLLGGLAKHDVSGFRTVTSWNDAPGRTTEDVITLLGQAAEKLEAEL